MGLGAFEVQNPFDKAQQAMQGSAQTAASMQKKTPQPEKSVGGAGMAAMGGAGTMAGIGAALGEGAAAGAIGGPWGLAIGAGVGLLSYLLA